MTKPEGIPEDVWEAAKEPTNAALEGRPFRTLAESEAVIETAQEAIARAIMAERERCAVLADTTETPDAGAYWIAERIAAAIRSPHNPKDAQ